jgi:hypothetical protein
VENQLAYQQEIGGSIPTSPLQFRFVDVPGKLAMELNARWHSVLPYIPFMHIQHAYGAYFEGRPYAVAVWGRPVARMLCNKGILELRRMAIAPTAPKNTASRMLAWMVRELKRARPDVIQFISYQDTEHHKGTIYKAAGWYPVETTGPINWDGSAQTNKPASRPRTGIILKAPKIRWQLDVIRNEPHDASLFD